MYKYDLSVPVGAMYSLVEDMRQRVAGHQDVQARIGAPSNMCRFFPDKGQDWRPKIRCSRAGYSLDPSDCRCQHTLEPT